MAMVMGENDLNGDEGTKCEEGRRKFLLCPGNHRRDAKSISNNRPGGDPPALLPLRLPASLLVSLHSGSYLGVQFNHGDASPDRIDGNVSTGSYSAVLIRSNGTDAGQDQAVPNGAPKEVPKEVPKEHTPLRLETRGGTKWYQSANDATGNFEWIGDTSSVYTTEASSAAHLKNFGEKARRRLEEERKNRKEIVRLDEADLLSNALPGGKPKDPPGKNSNRLKSEDPVPKKPVRKSVTARKGNHVAKRQRRDPKADGWMPCVDQLLQKATSKEDRSNLIRLHGLPLGVKPEHIRKFFHGLSPSLIFALPTFSTFIQGWDAAAFDSHAGGNILVERHPSHFRVFVKFQSAPVADAAMERSGESIGFEGGGARCAKKGLLGAAISLTPVPRYIASYLMKHMAIHPVKGESIYKTIENVEERIGSIADMAWSIAATKLKLQNCIIETESKSRHHPKSLHSHFQCRELSIPINHKEYQRLCQYYNQLVDLHQDLELKSSLLLCHTFDPSCLEDSAHGIAQSVSNWLLDQIVSCNHLLREARESIE